MQVCFVRFNALRCGLSDGVQVARHHPSDTSPDVESMLSGADLKARDVGYLSRCGGFFQPNDDVVCGSGPPEARVFLSVGSAGWLACIVLVLIKNVHAV